MIARTMNALLVGLLALSLWRADAWAQQESSEADVQFRAAALQGKWEERMQAGHAALLRGNFDEAIEHTKTALGVAETFGPDDIRIATTLADLAMLYRFQRNDAEAEPLLKRSLAIIEGHITAGEAANFQQLDHDEAERQGKILQDFALAFGPDNILLAAMYSNSETPYYLTPFEYDEAEPFFERMLQAKEEAFGSEHPEVVSCLKSLALIYTIQGEHDKFNSISERILAILEIRPDQ